VIWGVILLPERFGLISKVFESFFYTFPIPLETSATLLLYLYWYIHKARPIQAFFANFCIVELRNELLTTSKTRPVMFIEKHRKVYLICTLVVTILTIAVTIATCFIGYFVAYIYWSVACQHSYCSLLTEFVSSV